ncbi:MAG: heavy-metal-associated domain-containing protein [Bacteroidetes bacterium]|nr:heavy-metal-associated domain-containing protein [Bacteroidota bacterium]
MKITLTLFFAVLCSVFAYSQDKAKKEVKTIEFKVLGNCDQCKKRIENAAFIKGVKNAVWNEETKMLKVIFRADKVDEQKIHDAVAKSGHQTEKSKANDTAYTELPDCCKYKDKDCHIK